MAASPSTALAAGGGAEDPRFEELTSPLSCKPLLALPIKSKDHSRRPHGSVKLAVPCGNQDSPWGDVSGDAGAVTIAVPGEEEEPLRLPLGARRGGQGPGLNELAVSPEASSDASREGLMCSPPYGKGGKRGKMLNLATPSSCTSTAYRNAITPRTPDPLRSDFRLVEGNITVVMFDFDGTLTASAGEVALRARKQVELLERSEMLAPRLRALRDAELTLGIISKSTAQTIRSALCEAGLTDIFNGPIKGSALGLEGKAGFLVELADSGAFGELGEEGLGRVLLVDDDVRELDRAREKGIQTFAAPCEGGLQEEDFDDIFECLGVAAEGLTGPASREFESTPAVASPPASPHLTTTELRPPRRHVLE